MTGASYRDGPSLQDVDWQRFEEMRKLLAEWESYARTMADAGLIALPERLVNRTVGLLDATSC